MLNLLAKLLKILNAETAPWQISAGFVVGMMMGLTPLWSLNSLLLLLLLFGLRINLSAFILSLTLFSGIGYLFDPLMESFGAWLLANPTLINLWTTLYQSDTWRIAHYNNTLTLGSSLLALLLALPMLFICNTLIRNYRNHILAWVRKSKFTAFLKATRFYGLYNKLSGSGSL
ncbi:MAG: TIGR03546 family protein [Gammaproteobacteria bacterium]|nr:TIGR03546 family protein [Gammaproteobacteria bacterium]MCF6230788.1 TIGR03546 family protein [Gammaproteobacteria bacterium]